MSDKIATDNEAVRRRELAGWKTQPEKGYGYFKFPAEVDGRLYRADFRPLLTGAVIVTWAGDHLGTITAAHVYSARSIRSRMIAISVKGSNGAMYYGRADYDFGECITLHKRKA